MKKDIPGLLDKQISDKDQRKAFDRAIKFRGYYLELMIDVENKLEVIITTFLNGHKEEKIFSLLYHHLYSQQSFTLILKYTTVQQIARLSAKDSEEIMIYFKIIDKLVALRNVVAHYPVDYKYKEGISFYKPTSTFKAIKHPAYKEFTKDIKHVNITKEIESDIMFQITLIIFFLEGLRNWIDVEGELPKDYDPFQMLKASQKLFGNELMQGKKGVLSLDV
jgi:hypothetical protein